MWVGQGMKTQATVTDDIPQKTPKKAFATPGAWAEAGALVRTHRKRLMLGMVLMLISRLAGMVLPWMSGYVIDDWIRTP